MGFFKKLSSKKILLIGVGLLMVSLLFYVREINNRKLHAEYERQFQERFREGSEYRNKQIYNEYYSDRCEDVKQIDEYMTSAESIINNSNDVDSMIMMMTNAREYCDDLIYRDIDEYNVPSGLNSEHEQFIEGIRYIRDGIITISSAFYEYRGENFNVELIKKARDNYGSLIGTGLRNISESLNSIKSKID